MPRARLPVPGGGDTIEAVGMAENGVVRRQTMADDIYQLVREQVLDGTLAVGVELNQVHLARELNVSRVPVREALRRLQAERLIEGTPFQRYVVTGISPDALMELIDLREHLEVFAVRRQTRLSQAGSSALFAANKKLAAVKDPESWFQGDIALHTLLNGAGTEASRIVQDIRDRVHRYVRSVVSSPGRRQEACAEHHLIIEAMVAGDADEAERVLRTHIRHTRDMLARHFTPSAAGDTSEEA
jgi:DNA-binding GntR family transcriptional regulator